MCLPVMKRLKSCRAGAVPQSSRCEALGLVGGLVGGLTHGLCISCHEPALAVRSAPASLSARTSQHNCACTSWASHMVLHSLYSLSRLNSHKGI